jgi:hypothetical protein
MSARAAPWLAWSVCAVSLSLLVLALLMVILGWSTPLPGDWLWQEQATFVFVDLGAPLLGAFVASNRPGNPYGWAWLGFGTGLALSSFGQIYALYALWVQPGSLPAPGTVLVAATAGWVAAIVIMPFLLLLFPDGRLPSPRWRIVAWVIAFAGGVLLLLGTFRSDTVGPIKSPLGVEGAASEMIVAITDVGVYVVFAAVILCSLSLVFRYRRAAGIERQQIKWFAYAAALFGVEIAVSLVINDLFGLDLLLPYMVWVLLNNVPIAFLYVAVGIAILKYRLYDIDLIINRTLVYGSLTATLVALYFGGIVVLQWLFVILTGQKSTLAIVVSTLVIAALLAFTRFGASFSSEPANNP